MNLKKSVKKVEKSINDLLIKAEDPIYDIVRFIKQHKKLIVTLAIIYLVYKWLLDEDESYWV